MTISQVIRFYKKIGETPLQAVERFRLENPLFSDEKITYAGRLDPLAEGEMIFLTGEKCKEKEQFLSLDKVYMVDVLFGISTDTHDVLGFVDDYDKESVTFDKSILKDFIIQYEQKYPLFSSKTIKQAREGIRINEKDIPVKTVTVYDISCIKEYEISTKDLQNNIFDTIRLVSGDFRQKEIIEKWQKFFDENKKENFSAVTLRVHCSSGTYMRVLADMIGKKLGTKALALYIKREKIILD